MDSNVTVGFYSPSYKRPTTAKTHLLIPNLTYVVRVSEYDDYKSLQGCNVLAVEDSLIDCNTKARQWIIDNAKEDIVVEFDDDIEKFVYRTTSIVDIDRDTLLDEIYRLCQIQYDLGIGYGGVSQNLAPYNFDREFKFNKVVGGFVIFNREKYKANMDLNANWNEDCDKTLQELLENRIIMQANYLCFIAEMDTNKGGDSYLKNQARLNKCREYMKGKWGKYYTYSKRTNTIQIKVKR